VLQDDFPGAVSRVVPLELGPPVGWPVQYRVSGPNVKEVRDIAFRLAEIVASDSRAKRVNFDWIEPGRKIRVRIDQDQARLLGLSSESIAAKMNTVMSGAVVMAFLVNSSKVQIFRYSEPCQSAQSRSDPGGGSLRVTDAHHVSRLLPFSSRYV
jgi:multidrug efflux pump subunit AcrB